MKKKIFYLSMIFTVLVLGITVNASGIFVYDNIDKDGYIMRTHALIDTEAPELFDGVDFAMGDIKSPDTVLTNLISEYMSDGDYVRFVEITAEREGESITPEDEIGICFSCRLGSGNITDYMGENYRVFRIENEECVPLTITAESELSVSVISDKFGLFAIIYDPNIFSARFYSDYDDTLYYEKTNMPADCTELDIEQPKRDGYVFTKWTTWNDPDEYEYGPVSTLYEGARILGSWYANWEKADGYTPLSITLSAPEGLVKGKEDGKVIEITTSEGILDSADESRWTITGLDGVTVSDTEQVDPQTVRLTLSGSGSDIATDSELGVSFYSSLLSDTDKLQLNPNGTVRSTYKTDNTITVKGQAYQIRGLTVTDLSGSELDSIPEGSGFNINVDAAKLKGHSEEDKIITAVYGAHNELLYLDSAAAAFGEDTEHTFTFEIPPQDTSIGRIKAFIWSSFDSAEPLSDTGELEF